MSMNNINYRKSNLKISIHNFVPELIFIRVIEKIFKIFLKPRPFPSILLAVNYQFPQEK